MKPPKATPQPILENFYTVEEAAIRLNLRKPDSKRKTGEKWLRDGVNDPHNPFPHHRIAGQLLFSDGDLAEIAERHRNKTHGLSRVRASRRRPARPARAAA